MFDCYFTNVLTQRSRFEVLLTAYSQYFTRDYAHTLVLTIPRRRRAFIVSLNIEVFIPSCEQGGHFFFHKAPPSPVSVLPSARICPYFYGNSKCFPQYGNAVVKSAKLKKSKNESTSASTVVLTGLHHDQGPYPIKSQRVEYR